MLFRQAGHVAPCIGPPCPAEDDEANETIDMCLEIARMSGVTQEEMARAICRVIKDRHEFGRLELAEKAQQWDEAFVKEPPISDDDMEVEEEAPRAKRRRKLAFWYDWEDGFVRYMGENFEYGREACVRTLAWIVAKHGMQFVVDA
jgi:hypothetical protein